MNILNIINITLVTTITILFSYKIIMAIIGIFIKKKFPEAKQDHTYAILIAGRNESGVIGNLIESIKLQNYNTDLLRVFVVADNCTDNTAEVARICCGCRLLYSL